MIGIDVETDIAKSQADVNKAIAVRERAQAYQYLILAGMQPARALELSGLEA